jgi:hypothetical protein
MNVTSTYHFPLHVKCDKQTTRGTGMSETLRVYFQPSELAQTETHLFHSDYSASFLGRHVQYFLFSSPYSMECSPAGLSVDGISYKPTHCNRTSYSYFLVNVSN